MKYHTVIHWVLSIIMLSMLLTGCDTDDDTGYAIFMSITPDTLYADGNDNTFSQIDVLVTDNDDNPAQGLPVNFQTDLGNIQAEAVTASNGHAIAIYTDNGVPGIAHISASLENESQTFTDSLEIIPLPFKITYMQITPDSLWADGNIATYSEVRVAVEASNGFLAVGFPVYFSTDLGSMPEQAYTNNAGVALTYFKMTIRITPHKLFHLN